MAQTKMITEKSEPEKLWLVHVCVLGCKAWPSKHLVSTNAGLYHHTFLGSVLHEAAYCPGNLCLLCNFPAGYGI